MVKVNKKAFTLIELLVVIAIIGILATLAVVALQQARSRARDSKRVADVKQLQTALELFFNENGRYPTDGEWSSGSIGSNSGELYMYNIPAAPTPADGECLNSSNTYQYSPGIDGSTYTLSFCTGEVISNLPEGPKCLTPGGIVANSCESYLSPENPILPDYSHYEVFFEFEKNVVDVVPIGNDLIFIDTDKQLWKYSNGQYSLLHATDLRLGAVGGIGSSGHTLVYVGGRLFTSGDTKISEIDLNTWEINTIQTGTDNRFGHSVVSWNGNIIFAYIGKIYNIDTLVQLFTSDTYVNLSYLDDNVVDNRLWLPGYGIRYRENDVTSIFTPVAQVIGSQHRFINSFNNDLYCTHYNRIYKYNNQNDTWDLSNVPSGIRQIAIVDNELHAVGSGGIYNIDGDVFYTFSPTATTGKFFTYNGEVVVFASNKLLRPVR